KDLANPTPKIPKKKGRKRIMCKDCFLYLLFLTNSPKSNAKTQQQKSDEIFNKTGHHYSQQVISYNLKKYIYSHPNCLAVDEFSTHPGESPRYAWSRRGCPAVVKQKGRSTNYTLILCVLNSDGKTVISHKLIKNERKIIKDKKTGKVRIKKGTDTIDFYNFLKNIELPTNEHYYLLLDNSPIHDPPNRRPSKILREEGLLSMKELAREKNITLVYLPGYTPELNPAELCFNTVRHFTENLPTNTQEELEKAVDKIINGDDGINITLQKI
ncbi:5322_t:CDS:2, partial [Cetraspora pellucida]